MRDQSKPIRPPIPADFGERISAAKRSQAHYDQYVAPIVARALAATNGNRCAAYRLVLDWRYADDTTDADFALFGQAATALQS